MTKNTKNRSALSYSTVITIGDSPIEVTFQIPSAIIGEPEPRSILRISTDQGDLELTFESAVDLTEFAGLFSSMANTMEDTMLDRQNKEFEAWFKAKYLTEL